jgi:hypothetical protein
MFWRIGIGMAVGGVILIGWGVMEWRLGRGASATPERISLKQLIARGPEGNPNIILTDFVLCQNIVVTEKNGRWDNIYIPVIPADEAQQGAAPLRPTNVKAVLFSLNVHSEAEIATVLDKKELPALVTNRIRSLGSEEKDLLQKNYGGIDANTCLIIQEGRKPFSGTLLVVIFGGGTVLLLGGAGLLVWGVMAARQATPSRPKRKRRREEKEEEEEEEDERPRKRREEAEDEEDEPRPKRRRPRDEDES